MSGGNDSFTKILLHMDGANGGTTFTDSNFGGSAHTWTATTAVTNTGTFKFGTASENCGSTGWIDTPDSSDFTLGSGDWTVDFWFNRQGGDGTRRIACGQVNSSGTAASLSIFIELLDTGPANGLRLAVSNGTTTTTVVGTTAFTATGWNHVAGVRTGNTLKLFVNGVQEGGDIAYSGAVNDSSNKFAVGRGGELTTLTWNGFIDEFRLSVGIARWTSNFTPPTAPYDIGFNADVGIFTETGVAAIFNITELASVGSFAETGVAATFKPSLLSAAGAYAETGQAALFKTNFISAAGSYSVTGNAAPLAIGLTGSAGSYSVTGNAALFGTSMLSGSGAYLVTGNAATLTRDFEAWFPRPFDTDTWTASTKQAETWTPATKQAETWTVDPVTAKHPPVSS